MGSMAATITASYETAPTSDNCGVMVNYSFENDFEGWLPDASTVITSDAHTGVKAMEAGIGTTGGADAVNIPVGNANGKFCFFSGL